MASAAAAAAAASGAAGVVAAATGGGAKKSSPSDFFKQALGRPVTVKLNSGVEYRGILAVVDGYMNLAMEQTEEYMNGVFKANYGDAFIRGNNVLYVSASKRKMAV
eukprot:TRINITY_DN1945_c0_g2_i3.p2 TRINITY_DN1945_c0_g2~~TRINITY_DN1945_c0_g2_i3.p2  ORF type:complete len:106 (-),score=38.00 TRINITY_DN1945_c0_g2_i3:52-369(-)